MKLVSLILIATLSLAAVACGSITVVVPATETPAETSSAAPGDSSPAAPPEPTATPIPTLTPTPEPDRVSLEDTFSYEEMPDFLDAIAPMVAAFFQESYPNVPDPSLVYIPSRQVARSGCGYLYSDAYAYCAANEAIYVGQDLLWAFYQGAGDAAPAIALAHEFGHHIQYYRGVPYNGTAAASVTFENQADCLSGAWARYADQQGWLEREDDLEDVDALMRFIGSAESSRRDHGTTAERAAAFQSAFDTGAEACNAYFPDDPVA